MAGRCGKIGLSKKWVSMESEAESSDCSNGPINSIMTDVGFGTVPGVTIAATEGG